MASAILAVLVWALMATGTTAYYYLEQIRLSEQLTEKQESMDTLTENYDASATKKNLLAGDYSNLFGEYQWLSGGNYSTLMGKYGELLFNVQGNYSLMLSKSPDLNRTYGSVRDEFQTLNERITTTNETIVTKAEFGSLLDDFYTLFLALSTKEVDGFLGQVSEINVSLCIDYGNQTVEWHNTTTSPGTTLFDFTRKIAEVNYSYWPTIEPGHILVDSINDYADGYWIWYYWDDVGHKWIFGPVGCDAWILRNNGVYNWTCVK